MPVPQTGDAALRTPFRALVGELTAPCARYAVGAALDSSWTRALEGGCPHPPRGGRGRHPAGGCALLATRALSEPSAPSDSLARWLLAAAIALLVAELPLRLVGRERDVPNDDAAARGSGAHEGAAA